MPSRPSRREFVSLVGAGIAAAAGSRWAIGADAVAPAAPAAADATTCFFFVSDTHFLARRDEPGRMDERSVLATDRLVDVLNRLPGTDIPASAGGGTVGTPRGVIHGGDVIDSGDKTGQVFAAMQRTEWDAYTAAFGLDGRDGKLRYPIYEIHGNHDSPRGTGLVIDGIIARNRKRPGLKAVSANGLHYSWDWGPVHLVNLGIVVGATEAAPGRRRRYNPLESFAFLKTDLEKNVGASRRPVVITHHVDVARYATPCDPEAAYDNKEWDPCDVHGYYRLIRDYNVVAILYGHTHARQVFKWDGRSTRAAEGLNVFNVDESGHFSGPAHGLFYFELAPERMVVREYATRDNWRTAAWTQHWTFPIAAPARA